MAKYLNCFLIKHEGAIYANSCLYKSAITKGESAFRRLLASSNVTGKWLLDQVLFPVTKKQIELCEPYTPVKQDFDSSIKYLNVVSKETLDGIRKGVSDAFCEAHTISVHSEIMPELFKYKYFTFFKISDWNEDAKYRILRNLTKVKIFGSLYVALNAVDVRIGNPLIVTLID
jgi:hypothetical protein